MDKKRSRKDAACVSKRHLKRLAVQESEIVCDALLSTTTASYSNITYKCTEHLENVSIVNSEVKNIQAAENAVIENYNVHEWNESSNNVSNMQQSSVSDSYESQTDLASEDANVTDDNLKNDLAIWAVQHQISHTALKALLQRLKKHSCFSSLSVDVRSLLKTPRKQDIRVVEPGIYYHFGLQKSMLNILTSMKNNIDSIKIAINVDGLPLSKSSQQQFWPILGSIFPYNNVFTIGIYHGTEKPANVNDFLKDFVNEAAEMCENGIYVNSRNIQCRIEALICDTPAKAFVLCVKGHSGYSSCTKCTTEGEYVGNRICFPQIDAPIRSDNDFIQKIDDSYHKPDITCSLLKIPHFKAVTNVPMDYMHLVCLGIMRKLMYLWLNGEFYYRLQHRAIEEISTRLTTQLKPSIPVEFARKPRKIDYIKLWKATEYRQILLYTGPLAFNSILKKSVYTHFMTLHVIIRILCSKTLYDEHLSYAQDMILFFIKTFIKMYGVQNVSHNIHSLVHLVDDVKKFGPLDNFSAFRFENHMQVFKKYLRKAEKPLEQVVRRCIEKENLSTSSRLSTLTNLSDSILIHPTLITLHDDGPLLLDCNNPQYKIIKYVNGITFKTGSHADNCCGLNCGAIVCIENVAHCKKRNIPVIIGYEFLEKEDLFNIPCSSSLLGIYSVKSLSDLKSWPLKNVIKKYVKLPYENVKYAVFPLIHNEI